MIHLISNRRLHPPLQTFLEYDNSSNKPNCHDQQCVKYDCSNTSTNVLTLRLLVHKAVAFKRWFVQTVADHLEDVGGDQLTLVVDVVNCNIRIEENVPFAGLLSPVFEYYVFGSLKSFVLLDSDLLINLFSIVSQFAQNLLRTCRMGFEHRAVLIEFVHVLPPLVLVQFKCEIGS